VSVLAVFLNKNNPNNWRPCERESMERHFGSIEETDITEADKWKVCLGSA